MSCNGVHDSPFEHVVHDMPDVRSITYVLLMHLVGLACLLCPACLMHRVKEILKPMLLAMCMTCMMIMTMLQHMTMRRL